MIRDRGAWEGGLHLKNVQFAEEMLLEIYLEGFGPKDTGHN